MHQVSLTNRSWNSDLEMINGWKNSNSCQQIFYFPWWKHLGIKVLWNEEQILLSIFIVLHRELLSSLYLSICQSDLFVYSIVPVGFKLHSECQWVEDVQQPWTGLLDQRSRLKNIPRKIWLNFLISKCSKLTIGPFWDLTRTFITEWKSCYEMSYVW